MTDKDAMIEAVARQIALSLGHDFDAIFKTKTEWTAKGGMKGGRFHDINEPMQPDYLAASTAALTTLEPFIAACEQAAFNAGLEAAAKVALNWPDFIEGSGIAHNIRNLKIGEE